MQAAWLRTPNPVLFLSSFIIIIGGGEVYVKVREQLVAAFLLLPLQGPRDQPRLLSLCSNHLYPSHWPGQGIVFTSL